jgi:hypothetical protein
MPPLHEIRADYNRDSIVVYQSYRPTIAEPALAQQKFVAPFSFDRMTGIKPSFLWLMARSDWGQASGQEVTLAVRVRRSAWEEALGHAVLTDREADGALVHVQWDPERSLRGEKLPHRSIQVGLSRGLIRKYAEEWIVSITDLSPLVSKLRQLRKAGRYDDARRLLPHECAYPVNAALMRRLGMI